MRIGIVNDVALIAEALRRVVMQSQEHQVLWTALSGADAVRLCADKRPDLVLMDLIMPDMDGVETTRRIMQATPCAILVVTASPQHNTNLVFRALGAGALDVTATPVLSGNLDAGAALLAKIRTIGKLISTDQSASGILSGGSAESGGFPRAKVETLVAIGASTGGPLALARLFKSWTPPDHAAAVIVQHIDENFADSFARWLSDQVGFLVEVIGDGCTVHGGHLYLAKTNDHLVLGERNELRYTATPLDYPYRPSVDVFFECVARHWRRKAVGVLLTGMGRDGAEGLLAMHKAGMTTIAQDKASSAVYGMPRAAADLGAASHILPLDKIGTTLATLVNGKDGAMVPAPGPDSASTRPNLPGS